jgi:hypothetical protein
MRKRSPQRTSSRREGDARSIQVLDDRADNTSMGIEVEILGVLSGFVAWWLRGFTDQTTESRRLRVAIKWSLDLLFLRESRVGDAGCRRMEAGCDVALCANPRAGWRRALAAQSATADGDAD